MDYRTKFFSTMYIKFYVRSEKWVLVARAACVIRMKSRGGIFSTSKYMYFKVPACMKVLLK